MVDTIILIIDLIIIGSRVIICFKITIKTINYINYTIKTQL